MSYYESKMGEFEISQEIGDWVKPEELRLEHAIRLNKQALTKYGPAEGRDQWVYISEIVESKNPEQCKNMCLKIASQERLKAEREARIAQGGAGEEPA